MKKETIDFSPSTFAAIDAWIRAGESAKATRALETLLKERVPFDCALSVAGLARRLHQPAVGLRILGPLVRPQGKLERLATAQERVEYATCLTNIGAPEEALSLLSEVDQSEYPEASLAAAFAHFSRWEYHRALPLLRHYAAHPRVDAYRRLVGQVNLASAFVVERQHAEAGQLLQVIRSQALPAGYRLLAINCFHLEVANAIYRRDAASARESLKAARSLLETPQSVEAFFLSKWESILALLERPFCRETLGKLQQLKATAHTLGQWESARDIDRFIAVFTRDRALFTQVYFGTPYPHYREWLKKEWGEPIELSQTYDRVFGPKNGPIVDVDSASLSERRYLTEPGELPHRLLILLAADFYRPARIASLHYGLYPDEYFNPISFPARIHQLLARLRQDFARTGLSLEIVGEEGFYRLTCDSPLILRVPLECSLRESV